MRASPESERRVGILYYATESEGIGGVLKAKPSDFVVREVSQVELNAGEYLILEVTKENWDCLLYTSPSPRDGLLSRMPSSA